MPESSDPRLQLTPTQQVLFEALVDKRGPLGEWYRAAIALINDDGLPDRLALAAHAMREVMEKLPGDGVRADRGADLPTKVRRLRPPWDLACSAKQRGEWTGEISDPLRDFLVVMQEFFAGQDQLVITRREYTVQFLRDLEVIPAGLPDDVQIENAKQWMKFHRYFDGVAHHGSADEDAFREQLSRLESFLSARLIPRPTGDFAAIDTLVEEE
jgi:hypothetical protein